MVKKHVDEVKDKAKDLSKNRRNLIVVAAIALVIAVLLFVLLSPKRSVASYCETLKAENARLADRPGDSYATSVFTEQSSDPHDFVVSLKNLEKAAPDEIRPDVKTVRATFEKIEEDPSQLLAAGFGSISAENSIEQWNKDQCNL